MRGLYAIVDTEALASRGLEPLTFAKAILETRVAAIQLRDKGSDSRRTLRLLEQLAPMCRSRHVPLFANDRADLAALAGCDGVHLGQEDLPASAARNVMEKLRPGATVGVSVHNPEELRRSLNEAPDYLAFGPVFATRTKSLVHPPLGLDGLAQLQAMAPQLPQVAIGGIHTDNASALAKLCPCGAVIGQLLPHSGGGYREVATRAATLHRQLAGAT